MEDLANSHSRDDVLIFTSGHFKCGHPGTSLREFRDEDGEAREILKNQPGGEETGWANGIID